MNLCVAVGLCKAIVPTWTFELHFELKREEAPGQGKSWWAYLEAEIARERTADPWWEILRYADGQPVNEAVVRFFGAK